MVKTLDELLVFARLTAWLYLSYVFATTVKHLSNMSGSKKQMVTWKDVESDSKNSETSFVETTAREFVYSNTFEESAHEPIYTDTFVEDSNSYSYSNTFINEPSTVASKHENREGLFSASKINNNEHTVSFGDSETSIQEATHLETTRNVTEMLETVLEVDSDLSRTQDFDTMISETNPLFSYTDTFESSERTKLDSHYEDDFTEETATLASSRSDTYSTMSGTKTRKTFFSEDDYSLLDRSFIAPDYNGKS